MSWAWRSSLTILLQLNCVLGKSGKNAQKGPLSRSWETRLLTQITDSLAKRCKANLPERNSAQAVGRICWRTQALTLPAVSSRWDEVRSSKDRSDVHIFRNDHFRKHLHTLGIRNDSQGCRLCNKPIQTAKYIVLDYAGDCLGYGEWLCLVASELVMNQTRVLGNSS